MTILNHSMIAYFILSLIELLNEGLLIIQESEARWSMQAPRTDLRESLMEYK